MGNTTELGKTQFTRWLNIETEILEKLGVDEWKSWRPATWWFLDEKAKEMRTNAARYELSFAADLAILGIKCSFQYIFMNRMIADLAVPSARLLIEIDDPSHRDEIRKIRDSNKDRWASSLGWQIVRLQYPFRDNEKQSAIEKIVNRCESCGLQPKMIATLKIKNIIEKRKRPKIVYQSCFHYPTYQRAAKEIKDRLGPIKNKKRILASLRKNWHKLNANERSKYVQMESLIQ